MHDYHSTLCLLKQLTSGTKMASWQLLSLMKKNINVALTKLLSACMCTGKLGNSFQGN